MNPNFKFKAEIWLWSVHAGSWHFVTVPKKLSEDIKGFYEGPKRGFGSIKVKVTIGKSSWSTSIFPDSKRGSYVLPIKASVRKAENIEAGSKVEVNIALQ